MANTYTTLTSLFTAIANAIRSKTGSTAKIVADYFPDAIAGIQTGSDPVLEELSITENGEYTPDEGVDGFSKVTVTVESAGGGACTDTADATAEAKDLAAGKTAYVNGEKIVGAVPVVTSYSGEKGIIPQVNSIGGTNYICLNSSKFGENGKLFREGTHIYLGALPGEFGDASASDVVAGKTFTSLNGLTEGTVTSGTELISICSSGNGLTLTFQVTQADADSLLKYQPELKATQSEFEEILRSYDVSLETRNMDMVTFTSKLRETEWTDKGITITGDLWKSDYDLCLPMSALRQDSHGYFVYVMETTQTLMGTDKRVVRRDVYIENTDGRYAAVSGNLNSNDQVILSSSKPLSDGDSVRVGP